LCGSYHGGMKTMLYVQNQSDYEQWIQANTFAESDAPVKTVAMRPADLSDQDYLAPYGKEMGINPDTLEQLHALHHH